MAGYVKVVLKDPSDNEVVGGGMRVHVTYASCDSLHAEIPHSACEGLSPQHRLRPARKRILGVGAASLLVDQDLRVIRAGQYRFDKGTISLKGIRLCIIAALNVTVLLQSPVAGQVAFPQKPTYEQFVTAALRVSPERGDTLPRINQILDDTFVLFIPGVLGSKLSSASGDPIWGKQIMPQLESLKFSPTSPPAKAEVLDAYPLGVSRLDVYGEFDTRISAAIGGTASREEFAYDWREDIDITVDRLENQLRGEWAPRLKGKKLIVIAHSMGGVVAWRWKNKYLRKGGYDFTVSKLVLLGSPLRGSCEMLRMLLTGYRPNPNAGPLEERLYNLLFSGLRPAAYTFPGVFQLLPFDDDLRVQTSCLVVRDPTGLYAQRHFAIDVWDTHLFEFLAGGWFEESVWERLELRRSQFRSNLAELLMKARDFRARLDPDEAPLSGKVEYFYSNEHPTTSQVFVRGPGKLDETSGIWVEGDGRVMKESATNHSRYTLIPRGISSSHGDLVKDRYFMQFVDLELKKGVQIGRMRDIAAVLVGDAGATRSFGQSGLIVSLSDMGVDVLASDVFDPEVRAVVDLNGATVQVLNSRPENKRFRNPNPLVATYEMARYLDDEGRKQEALPLYETALASGVLKGAANEAYTLNRYGYTLISQGKYRDALGALLLARTIVAKSPGLYPKDFQANLLNNVGVAKWKTKADLDLVIKAWSEAARLGSAKAKSNVAILGLREDGM